MRRLAAVGMALAALAAVGPAGAAEATVARRTAVDPGVGQVVAWGQNTDGQTNVPADLRGVTAIAAGYGRSLAVRADGTVSAWGAPLYMEMPALTDVTAVAVGGAHAVALLGSGRAVAWGHDKIGVTAVPSGPMTAIAAGGEFSVALRPDGTVDTWGGLNDYRELDVPSGLREVTAIAAGTGHGLARRMDGTVVAWGDDTYGQSSVPAGLRGVVAIAAGRWHSLAVRGDGTVVAWGLDAEGQSSVPPGLTGVVAVSAGATQSLALRADGSVVGWGRGAGFRPPPAGMPPATGISAGGDHALALVTRPWRTCGSPSVPAAAVTKVAGEDQGRAHLGDGGPAVHAWLQLPRGLARTADGTVYIADTGAHRVRRIDPVTQVITTIAGTGAQGFNGDGGPAVDAVLTEPAAVAVSAAGDVLIADTGNSLIRRVDHRTGIITVLAGIGQHGFGGDDGPATGAALRRPQGLAVGPDGSVYVADTGNHRVRRITLDGTISTVVGTGTAGRGVEGGPATASRLHSPRGLVVGADGSVFVADALNHRVLRVDPIGVVDTVAGSGVRGCWGDGGPATAAGLHYPNGVALGSDGSVYVADSSNDRIRRVAPNGVISTLAGTGGRRPGDWLIQPQALIAGPSGTLLVSGRTLGQVHTLPNGE